MVAGDLNELFDLLRSGENEYIGIGNEYPWGGLYGGHIVAQALRAASATVAKELLPHSLRAYFIRPGDHKEVVRYEVDRIRDGRSFSTRRVVANQPGGAILNLEASFHRGEESLDISPIAAPTGLPTPEQCEQDHWSNLFDRRWIPRDVVHPGDTHDESGHTIAWMKVLHDIGDDPLIQACALAFVSDAIMTDAAIRSHPVLNEIERNGGDVYNASLDHSMWFHRPIRADQWHVHDVKCHSLVNNRGLTFGHVFSSDGTHACTVAQEALVRPPRK